MTGVAAAKTVVVGYNGSDGAKRALDWALERAGAGGRVVVVDATRAQPDRLARPSVDAMLHDRALECNASVELVFLDHAALGGPELVGEVAEDFPSTALLEAARRHDADEIVVGHRDRSRLRELSGSVSSALLRQRDRPAIVVVP
jgi:nucleotide-binding universal stress UspA family protein